MKKYLSFAALLGLVLMVKTTPARADMCENVGIAAACAESYEAEGTDPGTAGDWCGLEQAMEEFVISECPAPEE